MRTFDLSPLFRHSIGFDRMQRLLDAAVRMDDASVSYPPYNIAVTGEDAYRITMAVAGFAPEDIEITSQENTLVVAGKAKRDDAEKTYLHRGIAGRSFERRFELADHVKVVGANLKNGLLDIDVKRELPEAMRPKKIAIAGAAKTTIESQQAA